ncbi:hypothetical protein A6A06_38135 [Streptomyces sp. CB02923]|nr:hypothetical protein A6A06_38135 [Streptomyces sp. CB02923]
MAEWGAELRGVAADGAGDEEMGAPRPVLATGRVALRCTGGTGGAGRADVVGGTGEAGSVLLDEG